MSLTKRNVQTPFKSRIYRLNQLGHGYREMERTYEVLKVPLLYLNHIESSLQVENRLVFTGLPRSRSLSIDGSSSTLAMSAFTTLNRPVVQYRSSIVVRFTRSIEFYKGDMSYMFSFNNIIKNTSITIPRPVGINYVQNHLLFY